MDEKLIVSLTTWSARICNVPLVLGTVLNQTTVPDLIVLNLAYGEVIPDEVRCFIEKHGIEVNYVEDTKVYKKLLPTLVKYPDALVISIDDDWLYPPRMIEDFIRVHDRFPANPVSGNRMSFKSMRCHCGCASLTRYSYIEKYIDAIDEYVMHSCPSDDIVYTFFMNKGGHGYKRTSGEYFENMTSLNPTSPYSAASEWPVERSYDYLVHRFEKCRCPEAINGSSGPGLLVRLTVRHDYQFPYYISKLQNIKNCRVTLSVVSGYYDKACMEIAERSFLCTRHSYGEHLAPEGFDYVLDLSTVGFSDIPQTLYFEYRDEICWRNAVVDTFLEDSEHFMAVLKEADHYSLRVAGGSACLSRLKHGALGVRTITPAPHHSIKEKFQKSLCYPLSIIFRGPEQDKYLVVFGRLFRVHGRVTMRLLFDAIFRRKNQ